MSVAVPDHEKEQARTTFYAEDDNTCAKNHLAEESSFRSPSLKICHALGHGLFWHTGERIFCTGWRLVRVNTDDLCIIDIGHWLVRERSARNIIHIRCLDFCLKKFVRFFPTIVQPVSGPLVAVEIVPSTIVI